MFTKTEALRKLFTDFGLIDTLFRPCWSRLRKLVSITPQTGKFVVVILPGKNTRSEDFSTVSMVSGDTLQRFFRLRQSSAGKYWPRNAAFARRAAGYGEPEPVRDATSPAGFPGLAG